MILSSHIFESNVIGERDLTINLVSEGKMTKGEKYKSQEDAIIGDYGRGWVLGFMELMALAGSINGRRPQPVGDRQTNKPCGESLGIEFCLVSTGGYGRIGSMGVGRKRKSRTEKEGREEGEEGRQRLSPHKNRQTEKKRRGLRGGEGRLGVGRVCLLKGQGTEVTRQASIIIIITLGARCSFINKKVEGLQISVGGAQRLCWGDWTLRLWGYGLIPETGNDKV